MKYLIIIGSILFLLYLYYLKNKKIESFDDYLQCDRSKDWYPIRNSDTKYPICYNAKYKEKCCLKKDLGTCYDEQGNEIDICNKDNLDFDCHSVDDPRDYRGNCTWVYGEVPNKSRCYQKNIKDKDPSMCASGYCDKNGICQHNEQIYRCWICNKFNKDRCGQPYDGESSCTMNSKIIKKSQTINQKEYISYLDNDMKRSIKGQINCERPMGYIDTTLDKCNEISKRLNNNPVGFYGTVYRDSLNSDWQIGVTYGALVFSHKNYVIGGIQPDTRIDNKKGGRLFDTMGASSTIMDIVSSGNILSKGVTIGALGDWAIKAAKGNLLFCYKGYVMTGVRCCKRSDGKPGGKFFAVIEKNNKKLYIDNLPSGNIRCRGNVMMDIGNNWTINVNGNLLLFCHKGYVQSGVKCCARNDDKKGGKFFTVSLGNLQKKFIANIPEKKSNLVFYLKSFNGNGINTGKSFGNDPKYQIIGDQTITFFINAQPNGRQNPIAKAFGGEGTITLETNGQFSYYYGSAGRNGNPYNCATSGKGIIWGQEFHVTVVRSMSTKTIRWYINGNLTASHNLVNKTYCGSGNIHQIRASNNPLLIGRGYTNRFKGSLRDIRIYNIALEPSDILALKRQCPDSYPYSYYSNKACCSGKPIFSPRKTDQARSSGYRYYSGISTPIKCLGNGKLACASNDGRNCFWGTFNLNGSLRHSYSSNWRTGGNKPLVIGCPKNGGGWVSTTSKKPACELTNCNLNTTPNNCPTGKFVWCDGTNNPNATKTLKCGSNNSVNNLEIVTKKSKKLSLNNQLTRNGYENQLSCQGKIDNYCKTQISEAMPYGRYLPGSTSNGDKKSSWRCFGPSALTGNDLQMYNKLLQSNEYRGAPKIKDIAKICMSPILKMPECSLTSYSIDFNGFADNDSFKFNGNNFIDIPDKIAPQLTDSSLSILFWANISSSINGYNIIYSQGTQSNSAGGDLGINIYKDNRQSLTLYITFFGDSRNKRYLQKMPLTKYGDKWHHYAIVRDQSDGNLYLYIDGINQNLPRKVYPRDPGNNFIASGPVNIGKCIGKGNHFKGSLKKLSVYDKVLSLTEIKKFASNPHPSEPCPLDALMYLPMNIYQKKVYYRIPKLVIRCFNQPKNFVPFSKKISDPDISKYATLKTFITGENATLCRGRGRCPGQSLVSQNLIQNKICIKCSTYIDDTLIRNHKGGSATSSSNSEYLLYNYNKQWWVSGGGNRRVSAVFNFSVPVKLTNFIFATYNGGRIGRYRGWNLYYKKDNSWVKVLDYNNRSVYIPSADYISSERSHGIPISNSEFSNEWKFEVRPTRNVYIYWVKMYGYIYTNKKKSDTYIYGIGKNGLLYTMPSHGGSWTQANMKKYDPLPSSKNTCCIDYIKIYNGDGYILAGTGIAVWKGLSPNTRYSGPFQGGAWLNRKDSSIAMKQIDIYNDIIYGVGKDAKLYTMPISGGIWCEVSMNKSGKSCCIDYIKIYKDHIYALGNGRYLPSAQGKLYKWNLDSNSRWLGVPNNSIKMKQIEIYDDIIYGISYSGLLYTRSISGNSWVQANMKKYDPLPSSKNTCCIDYISIFNNDGYILSGSGIAIWKGLSPNTRYSGPYQGGAWLNKRDSSIPMKQIMVYDIKSTQLVKKGKIPKSSFSCNNFLIGKWYCYKNPSGKSCSPAATQNAGAYFIIRNDQNEILADDLRPSYASKYKNLKISNITGKLFKISKNYGGGSFKYQNDLIIWKNGWIYKKDLNSENNNYIKYGTPYYFKNLYNDPSQVGSGGGSYIGACGGSAGCPRQQTIGVYTYKKHNSNLSKNKFKTGQWSIRKCNIGGSAGKYSGNCSKSDIVRYMDTIAIEYYPYSRKNPNSRYYLNTCGRASFVGCSSSPWPSYAVSITNNIRIKRYPKIAYWTIISTDPKKNQNKEPIKLDDQFRLLNLYGSTTYLYICGYKTAWKKWRGCNKGQVYGVVTKSLSTFSNDIRRGGGAPILSLFKFEKDLNSGTD